uniref:Envelope polyprotein n=1 Tax=Naja naja TaxID=35670 RepID=A0A8C6XT04_NAJNA
MQLSSFPIRSSGFQATVYAPSTHSARMAMSLLVILLLLLPHIPAQNRPGSTLLLFPRVTTNTLIYHIQKPRGCTALQQTCQHNQTMYHLCNTTTGTVCYSPEAPIRLSVTALAGYSSNNLCYLNHTIVLKQGTTPAVIIIDACSAMDKYSYAPCGSQAWRYTYQHNHKYICNPIPCAQYCKKNDGTGADPTTFITMKIDTLYEGQEKSLGWSVYDNLRKLDKNPLQISPKTENLFIELAETIAKQLLIKNCFVCGGTNMGEQWPWEALEASPNVLNNMSAAGNTTSSTRERNTIWSLTTNLIGKNCFTRNGSSPVGHPICMGTWDPSYESWTSPSNLTQPLKFVSPLLSYLNESEPIPWPAPKDMYWICGSFAYEILPANWSGSCVLGWIKPSFFLLPVSSKQTLGVPVYESLGARKRRSGNAFSNFPCKELAAYEESTTWDSERIVCVYGQATWAEDGSWGYRTPIYMLNRIIRLQAVLDLAGERIDKALNTIAEATDQLRTAVYQNWLAMDYLLAKEGGVCGKFNLSNCCLQINEVGKVVKKLTMEIRQLTYNAPQEWKGINLSDLFSSWFPKLPGLQAIVALIGMIALGCLILPCILPIFVRTLTNSLSASRMPCYCNFPVAFE